MKFTDNINLIPALDLIIKLDESKTTGYDLTVENDYTFLTHDGVAIQDTMAIYTVFTNQAQKELKEKMMTATSAFGIDTPNIGLSKNMLSGIFRMTKTEPNPNKISKDIKIYQELKKLLQNRSVWQQEVFAPLDVDVTVKIENTATTIGRTLFTCLLPPYMGLQNKLMDKKNLSRILTNLMQTNKQHFVKVSQSLMRCGFFYATKYPMTLSLDAVQLNKKLKDLKKAMGDSTDQFVQYQIEKEMEKELLLYLQKDFPGIYNMVKSKASKGEVQIRQMLVAKGLFSDPKGDILPAITASIAEGYDPRQYFEASAGSRKGVIDRAINTAEGGYSYRKTVYIAASTQLNKVVKNCGTTRGLKLELTEDMFEKLQGRNVMIGRGAIRPIMKTDVGNTIILRSPIYCQTNDICPTCYGELWKQLKTVNIGLCATQAGNFAERIMKSFHLGASVDLEVPNVVELMNQKTSDQNLLIKNLTQKENEVFNNNDLAIITIDVNLFPRPNEQIQLDEIRQELVLTQGYFNLMFEGNNLEIPVSLDTQTTLNIPEVFEKSKEQYVLTYAKNDRMFNFKVKIKDYVQIAKDLERIYSGIEPWRSPENLLMKLINQCFILDEDYDLVHTEVILSNCLRNKEDPTFQARLLKPYDAKLVSIKKLPQLQSNLLGLAFENFNDSVASGLTNPDKKPCQLEKIITGEPLVEDKKNKIK